jgi:LexA-binding, inner membrane-associated putative hydrolase
MLTRASSSQPVHRASRPAQAAPASPAGLARGRGTLPAGRRGDQHGFTPSSGLAVHHLSGLTGKIVLGVILGVILSAGVRALQIGGHHGDLIGLAGAAAAVYWQAGLALVPLCIALGVAAHIAGDELTHDGCPLAWPLSRQEFHLLPRRLQIATGRFAETWIVSTLLLAGLGYLLYRDTGIAGVMTHLHFTGRTAP